MKNTCSLLVFASIALTANSHAADLIWDPGNTGNGSAIDPGNGTWNATAGNIVWNDASGNVIWAQTSATSALNDATFGGGDGTYAITVGGSMAAGKITFLNSGYTLSSGSARTITIDREYLARAAPRLEVAAGKTATIGNNITILGDFTFSIGATAANGNGGTLNIESGAVVRPESTGNSIQLEGIGTIINVRTGGFLGTQSGAGNAGFNVGANSSSGDVTLNVDGGTVNVQGTGTSGAFVIGSTGKGTVTLGNSGSITIHQNKTNGLTFGNSTNAATNTFHLDGGTLTTRIVREAGGTSIFNFNGGTLKANSAASGGTFMTGLDQANVKSGGAKVDTNGNTITIGQALLDGGGSTAGGLEKLGAGTLILTSGGNTFKGQTKVSAGALALNHNLALQNSALDTTGAGTVTLGTGVTTPTVGGLSGATGDLGTAISSGYTSVTALTLNPNSGSVSYGGNIANGAANMSLAKTGGGTQVLSGANTYSGATAVNAGTLLVNGTHITSTAGSGYTVSNAGSTLGGTGRLAVNGNVSVETGAVLAPGASIGTLTLDGATTTGAVLSMNSGSKFGFELDGSGGAPDQLAFWNYLSGDLGLNDNAIDLSLLGTQTQGTYTVEIFRFFSDGGTTAATHAFTGGLAIGTLGTGISSASIDWDGTGNNDQTIALTYTVVPEPSAALLGGLGLLALLRRRRR